MKTPVVQRWRDHRGTYRPAGEVIDTRSYEVVTLPDNTTAKAFVQRHHYAGSFSSSVHRFGLFRGRHLVGVAVFGNPMRQEVFGPLPGEGAERLELSRLVLLDEVPANGESFLVAECFRRLRQEGVLFVVSCSDPVPRTDLDDQLVFRGHIGTIYQALNGVYVGRTKKRVHHLLPNGQVFSPRTLSKIQTGVKGWRYGVQQLLDQGAIPPEPGESLRDWVARELDLIGRRFPHEGNHKYLWSLDRRLRKHLPQPLPYPKFSP